ncbi:MULTISPECIES: amidohydrolase family protein [Sphingopyxis]|uniref:amidohydrolase family protein n=1 Tax=Sphingopyxis TaxID=165697 RepID=UPI00086CC222|nr:MULTISPECIES: amidohydrolase family protein [Sphingopyxis]APW72036.1 imidazolonepropionase [Sphingopyxis granuli]AVA12784.1 imidazolonepropionase [Sphingopyxis sp. MG]ODU29399.1 MAG: imidazolonepropionase [Sphingopyxis sp. SCN 67-31]
MIRFLAACAALALAAPAAAETIAIVDATLLTMTEAGTIGKGTVLIRDGRIASIGANVAVPPDARIVDGRSGVVTPGFIQADSTLGAVEVSQVPASADRATHSRTISAGFDISLGLNPDSILLPVSRLAGITHAVTTPLYDDRSGRDLQFSGQAAVIDLAQRPDMVTRPRVAMVLEMGEGGAERAGGARGSAIVALRATLADVRHFARHRAAYDRGEGRPQTLSRIDLEALVPVAEGRMPLIVKVDRASDIVEMIALAREEGLRIILDGAEEGWRVADAIAAAKVPVIVDPLANLPHSFSQVGASMDNAARLHAAGVAVVLKAGSGVAHRARELRYSAGNAVAWGLPHDAAVAAITINPARVFGVADRIGSLAVGRAADLILWSGDPLEPLSQPRLIFVEGLEKPLTARPLDLRDRYLP